MPGGFCPGGVVVSKVNGQPVGPVAGGDAERVVERR